MAGSRQMRGKGLTEFYVLDRDDSDSSPTSPDELQLSFEFPNEEPG